MNGEEIPAFLDSLTPIEAYIMLAYLAWCAPQRFAAAVAQVEEFRVIEASLARGAR
ncbi:hypothetical protein GCM10010517_36410 [Streptosporangium fragile]|uniref:Uncharacterized protein n=1 Tax=Streptosporangium fragile TaxID=46186 RepID=A0ABP6IG46_9ACTN